MSNKRYEPELKEKLIRLHLEEGRSVRSLTEEYRLGQGTLKHWLKERSKEGLTNTLIKEDNASYAENLRLRKELAELQKENAFLKKAAAFFAKEID
jgi:transposase